MRLTQPYRWHFRTGDRVQIEDPGAWQHGRRGEVVDVLGAGRDAAVALRLEQSQGRVIVLRAHRLRLMEEGADLRDGHGRTTSD